MSLNLKSIQFDNLNQVKVSASASNVGRSYGRRFTVSIGENSKDVTLKDLYKKAQKLTKKATSASELNDVNSFIAKLENAETAAAKIYKDRDDCVYKFRSWFHRFFGGAFLGSHMDRFEKLHNKLLDKFEVMKNLEAVGTILGICDTPENLIKSVNLTLENLNNSTVNFGHKKFNVWVQDNTLNFQEKSKIGKENGLLQIKLENQYTIIYEGEEKKSIPEEAKPLFNAVLLQMYKNSSVYRKDNFSDLYISIRREGLDLDPEWHLEQFCMNPGSFVVKFVGEAGIDDGGLSREYVGKLASMISDRQGLFADVEGSLKIPRIVRANEDSVLYCNPNQIRVYNNFGKFIFRCYKSHSSDSLTTGRLFSDALFKAAFSLSGSELKAGSIKNQEAQVRVAKILLNHLDDGGSNTIQNVIQCFNLLDCDLDVVSDQLKMALFLMGEETSEPYMDDNLDPDIEKIKSKSDQFKKDLFETLMKNSHIVDQLNQISLGSMIDPIFQIAVGMRDKNWDSIRMDSVDNFSSKVQGSMDRVNIIESIDCESNNLNIIRKVEWIKEWIAETTDADVKAFLKFATGSTSLPSNQKPIYINVQLIPTPFPTASTCSSAVSISDQMRYHRWREDLWDDTKEAFIRNLQVSINTEGFQTI